MVTNSSRGERLGLKMISVLQLSAGIAQEVWVGVRASAKADLEPGIKSTKT